ncbi:hypothetical protein PG990_004674 [Apiospora arundinis]
MLARLYARIPRLIAALLVLCLLLHTAQASTGDRLPEFRECVKICERENCYSEKPTPIPIHRRLLLWTCPQECDHTCQHIVTAKRVARGEDITQFHGKWPFVRVLGMQEPFSVLFSVGNFLAHQNGLAKLREQIPASYHLRPYYEMFAYFGMAAWVFSTIFHIRDFAATEQMDYLAAGADVLYGMYYTPMLVFRVERPSPRRQSLIRLWTILCCTLYGCHVLYLKMWKWDYSYNMTANVIVGLIQNSILTYWSYKQYREIRQLWTILPGILVAWLLMAMSLELLDFPPLWGGRSMRIVYGISGPSPSPPYGIGNFLVKDAQEDISSNAKLKF